MKIRVVFVFSFLVITCSCYSQNQKCLTFIAGYGYHEAISLNPDFIQTDKVDYFISLTN